MKHGRTVEYRAQQRKVEVEEKGALRSALVALMAKDVNLDRIVFPTPYFADAEAAMDLELVDPTAGPYDLDRQVGSVPILVAYEVAFVRL